MQPTTISKTPNMEISNLKRIDKNSLVATFDLTITKWGNFIIRNMTLFEKGSQRWIGFPSRKYEEDGKPKYFIYNGFKDRNIQDAFQKQVLKLLEPELAKQNIQQTPQSTNEVPF